MDNLPPQARIWGICAKCEYKYDLTIQGIGCPKCKNATLSGAMMEAPQGPTAVLRAEVTDAALEQAKKLKAEMDEKKARLRKKVRDLLSQSDIIDALASDPDADPEPELASPTPVLGTCADCGTKYTFTRKDYFCPVCRSRKLNAAQSPDGRILYNIRANGSLVTIEHEDVWAARVTKMFDDERSWLEDLYKLEDKREPI
jgi:Zn finger protein HypA/HybF involved in hydrogenase expression